MKTNWSKMTTLIDPDMPVKLASEYGVRVPPNFLEFVESYNGGMTHPCPYIYNQVESKGVVIKGLLSFNESDNNSVFNTITKLVCYDKSLHGIPFAYSDKGVISILGNSVLHRDDATGEIWVLDKSFAHFMKIVL